MAKCLSKIKCSKCGSSDGCQPFLSDDGKITGFCFSCSTFHADPYGDNPPDTSNLKVKSLEDIQEEILEIKDCGYVGTYRGIPAKYWQRYGVRASLNQMTGKGVYAVHHPRTKGNSLVGYMTKTVAKKAMWMVSTDKEYDLYGWLVAKQTGARTLYITEGEEDCLAVDYILEEGATGQYAGMRNAVTSLPNGTKSVDVLGRMAQEIKSRFQEVVFVFDDDDAGRAAIRKALNYFPSAHTVVLPAKDANDCVKAGLMKEAFNALTFRKSKALPAGLVTFNQVRDDLNKVAAFGDDTPWPLFTNMIRGLHQRRLYGIAGGEGLGKSSFIHMLAAHNLVHNKKGVLFIQMEEDPEESFLNIGSKILGRDLTDPHNPITDIEKDTLAPYYEKLFVFNINEDRTTSALELQEHLFDLARAVIEDIGYMYIDNLTKLSEALPSAAERNDFISSFTAYADTFARRTDTCVVVLSHFNKQAKGETPYNEGGRGNMNQLAGSAGLQRYASGIFLCERNNQGVSTEVIKLRIVKNRVGRATGVVKMRYDPKTTLIHESYWDDDLFQTKK